MASTGGRDLTVVGRLTTGIGPRGLIMDSWPLQVIVKITTEDDEMSSDVVVQVTARGAHPLTHSGRAAARAQFTVTTDPPLNCFSFVREVQRDWCHVSSGRCVLTPDPDWSYQLVGRRGARALRRHWTQLQKLHQQLHAHSGRATRRRSTGSRRRWTCERRA